MTYDETTTKEKLITGTIKPVTEGFSMNAKQTTIKI